MKTSIRQLKLNDIQLISDYWLKSSDGYLISLGADVSKFPSKTQFEDVLTKQINNDIEMKQSYALIWEINKLSIGHCNVNNIIFGEVATMHLHIWNSKDRKKGVGLNLLNLSIEYFFESLSLKK